MNSKKVFVNVNNAKGREAYKQQLQEIAAAGYDPFSLEEIERSGKTILKKKDYWFVIKNDHPYPGSKHHFLVIIKEYAESVIEISKAAFTELHDILTELNTEYEIPGGGLWMRYGDTDHTGATVKRLHSHVIVADPTGNGVRIPLG